MSKGRLSTIPPRLSPAPKQLSGDPINSTSWRSAKTTAASRGYDARWREYRQRYLMQHPLCVYCEREGRTTAATVVDHILPHKGDMALFWKLDNHQSLCAWHHNSTKALEERKLGFR
uniref:HNH endonuclease n=1 Tax=Xanthomonas phage MK21 TaxID=3148942 RepID=A0AAU8BVA2_9CAUD